MRVWWVSLCVLGLAGCYAPNTTEPLAIIDDDRQGDTGTDGNSNSGTNGTNDPDPVTDELSAVEVQLFEAINRERTDRGLQAVALRSDLNCAAQIHSEDIGERRACTHTGSDGSSPGSRVASCSGSGWSGEIVACGHSTAEGAVQGWLGSPGHHDIMLTPGQRWIGVAMHNNYWTAIFDR